MQFGGGETTRGDELSPWIYLPLHARVCIQGSLLYGLSSSQVVHLHSAVIKGGVGRPRRQEKLDTLWEVPPVVDFYPLVVWSTGSVKAKYGQQNGL